MPEKGLFGAVELRYFQENCGTAVQTDYTLHVLGGISSKYTFGKLLPVLIEF